MWRVKVNACICRELAKVCRRSMSCKSTSQRRAEYADILLVLAGTSVDVTLCSHETAFIKGTYLGVPICQTVYVEWCVKFTTLAHRSQRGRIVHSGRPSTPALNIKTQTRCALSPRLDNPLRVQLCYVCAGVSWALAPPVNPKPEKLKLLEIVLCQSEKTWSF